MECGVVEHCIVGCRTVHSGRCGTEELEIRSLTKEKDKRRRSSWSCPFHGRSETVVVKWQCPRSAVRAGTVLLLLLLDLWSVLAVFNSGSGGIQLIPIFSSIDGPCRKSTNEWRKPFVLRIRSCGFRFDVIRYLDYTPVLNIFLLVHVVGLIALNVLMT